MWCGVDDKSMGREREGCALLMSPRVWECIEAHKWKGSKIVWAVGKAAIVRYSWICVYEPIDPKSRKGREDIKKFWNYVNEFLMEI